MSARPDLAQTSSSRAGSASDLQRVRPARIHGHARRPTLARSEILDRVWGTSGIVTERSVDRCVTTLRSKIEPDPGKPTWIKTIRDVGDRSEVE
ncbi:MAG: winged helix-turn-helix domain-containing protein [Planctomycetales bacterium]